MPYIAPQSTGLSVLSGALGGASRGAQTMLEHRWKQKETAERRRMHEEELTLSRQRLDAQIEQSTLDRASTEKLSQMNRDLEIKLKGREIESLEKRATEVALTSVERAGIQAKATTTAAGIRAREQRRATELRQQESEAQLNETGSIIEYVTQIGYTSPPTFKNEQEQIEWMSTDEAKKWSQNMPSMIENLADRLSFNRSTNDSDRERAEDILTNLSSIKRDFRGQLLEMTKAKTMGEYEGQFEVQQETFYQHIGDMAAQQKLVNNVVSREETFDYYTFMGDEVGAVPDVLKAPDDNWDRKWKNIPEYAPYHGIMDGINEALSSGYANPGDQNLDLVAKQIRGWLDSLNKSTIGPAAYGAIANDIELHMNYLFQVSASGENGILGYHDTQNDAVQAALQAAGQAAGFSQEVEKQKSQVDRPD